MQLFRANIRTLEIVQKRLQTDSLICILIFTVALIPRVITALQQGWLADEVFVVDQVGKWFLNHLGEYIFQIKHIQYPPVSPYFVNPPFAMWLMTVGMYVAEKFGIDLLFGARMVNIVFGSLTCVLVYIFCKKFCNKKVGVMASLILAFSPIYIANNSSAYLDTVLSFLTLLDLYLFFSFIENRNKWYLYSLAIMLGLSLITKLSIIPLIVLIIIYLLYFSINNKDNRYMFIKFLIIFISTPFILWAGARDMNHILGVFDYVVGTSAGEYQRMFADYSDLTVGGASKGLYYFLMVIGTATPVVGLLFPIMAAHLSFKGLYFKLKKSIDGFLFRQVFMLLIVIFSLISLNYFGLVKSTVHRIIFINPIIIILTMNWLLENIESLLNKSNLKNIEKPILFLVLLASISPAFTWSPEFYNSYNNFLIGGIQGASNLYRVGDGEGLEIVGNWLNNNTDANTKIAVLRFDYLLKKYTNRSLIKQPLNKNIDFSLYRGVSYLVVHNSHVSGQLQPKINFGELNPEFIVYVKDAPYIYVYNLEYYKNFSTPISTPIGSKGSKNKDNEIYASVLNSTLELKYKLNNGWASINTNFSYLPDSDGVSIEVYGDAKKPFFELGFYDRESKSYLYGGSQIDWDGWRRFYFAFSEMKQNIGWVNISEADVLRIVLISKENIEGTVYVRNISIIKKK